MVVSKPIRVMVEIEDKETGCIYVYQGANINDCTQYFQSMFFGKREYRVVNSILYEEGEIGGRFNSNNISNLCNIHNNNRNK